MEIIKAVEKTDSQDFKIYLAVLEGKSQNTLNYQDGLCHKQDVRTRDNPEGVIC